MLDVYQEELARYAYKPDVELRIEGNNPQGLVAVRIIRMVECAEKRDGSRIPVAFTRAFPGDMFARRRDDTGEYVIDHENFARFLIQIVCQFERHEALEWLRRDGEQVQPPHQGE
jgi:hypothetical protein